MGSHHVPSISLGGAYNCLRTTPSPSAMSLIAMPERPNIEPGKSARIILILLENPCQRNPEFHQN